MTLETATYINDLQPVNPPSTDPVSQGDDHLRLIKQVLQNQFQGASRQWQIPGYLSVTATPTTLTKANGENVVFVNSNVGPITINLPNTLAAADIGWACTIIKYTTDVNPVFITPPSGTILSGSYSVTRARRCVPGVPTRVFWNGAAFIATRVTGLPIGTMLEFWGSTLPAGYEWPNGQTLASVATNYPEWNAVYGSSGTTPDLRGYATAVLDNLGGTAAGHLPTTYIASTTLGAVGGGDHQSLGISNMASYTPSGTIANGAITISHNANYNNASSGTPGPYTVTLPLPGAATISASQGTSTFSGNNNGGTSAPFTILQPTVMLGKIMVVE